MGAGNVRERHQQMMTRLVISIIEENGEMSSAEVADYAEKSEAWANMYLKRAMNEGRLVKSMRRPFRYSLPTSASAPSTVDEGVQVVINERAHTYLRAMLAVTDNTDENELLSRLIMKEVQALKKTGFDVDKMAIEMFRHEKAMRELAQRKE